MRAARTAPIRRGDGGVRLWNIATAAPPECNGGRGGCRLVARVCASPPCERSRAWGDHPGHEINNYY